jgi:hypothetical protein
VTQRLRGLGRRAACRRRPLSRAYKGTVRCKQGRREPMEESRRGHDGRDWPQTPRETPREPAKEAIEFEWPVAPREMQREPQPSLPYRLSATPLDTSPRLAKASLPCTPRQPALHTLRTSPACPVHLAHLASLPCTPCAPRLVSLVGPKPLRAPSATSPPPSPQHPPCPGRGSRRRLPALHTPSRILPPQLLAQRLASPPETPLC